VGNLFSFILPKCLVIQYLPVYLVKQTEKAMTTDQTTQLESLYNEQIKESQDAMMVLHDNWTSGKIDRESYTTKLEKYQTWVFEAQDKLKGLR
jgi:hypothetical protein